MTDCLGPLTLGTSGTYILSKWERSPGGAAVEVLVTAASTAALTTALNALVAELRQGSTWAHTFIGASSPVVYTVQGVADLGVDEATGPLAYWARVTCTLSLSASPAGALTTLYSAQHVDSPASLALSTSLLGLHPPQLDVTVDDDSTRDMHCVICAIAPKALTDAMWRVKASSLTWTTMTNATGATDSWVDGTTRTTTSSSYQTAPLDTADYPEGKYTLWAHVKQSAGTGYVKDSWNDEAVSAIRTTMHLLCVGDVDLPVADAAPGSAANLTLSVKSDGTNTLTVDAFLLIPRSWGYFEWHPDTATTELDQLDVGPTGIYMDGVCDTTYLRGSILRPRILAAHTGTLVTTASPTGNTWPTDWGRSSESTCSASTNRFVLLPRGTANSCWYAATNAATPIVVPGAWYELSFTRWAYARTTGSGTASIVWQDVDGNTVREDLLETVSSTDASPVAVLHYAKAPAHAARAQVKFASISTPTLDYYYYTVVLRRCPLRLIVAAEDAGGALSSNYHPVHVTVKYQPLYEVAR